MHCIQIIHVHPPVRPKLVTRILFCYLQRGGGFYALLQKEQEILHNEYTVCAWMSSGFSCSLMFGVSLSLYYNFIQHSDDKTLKTPPNRNTKYSFKQNG
jgi:hypothetical protein